MSHPAPAPATAPAPAADTAVELSLKILKLEKRLQRERHARIEAEAIAERGLSELYENQRRLALMETIATRANESRTVDETLRFAVEAICGHTGWLFGNVYTLSPRDPGRLLPAGIFHAAEGTRLDAFIETSRRMSFARGTGLPGRVLESGRAAWIVDVTTDPNFPRAAVAQRCGLHAAFAFPVLAGSDVMAVMEFFFRERMEPDAALLAVMAQIGTQLGRVMERARAEQKLIHDATHDPLTGLPNRLLFMDRLERAVAVARRRPESAGFAVLFVDLDRFKLVNDSLGHAAGDTLLSDIARRLAAVLEAAAADLGAVATLARLGGDEFTVLLEEIDHEGVAVEVAGRIQAALARPVEIDGQEVYTSASIGVASSATAHDGAAEIMRDADLAMYRAKTEGRARVELFDQSLHASAMKRLAIESDLRGALRRQEFVLHYQPIVALGAERLVGFEALVRWRRASGEVVPPGEFIAIAEDTGLIVFLGAWVMREAFATLARWQREHPRETPLSMSVNVSPRQFHQPDFVETVIDAVSRAGCPPQTVRLEITESVTIQDAGRTIAILERLRAFGVRVSIDDFGTGYSSLSYLHQLPFDTLKIDRSFVAALQTKADGREIIRTILDLARNLEMDVVAEGAETASHVAQLTEMGCGYAQGFYFSKPLDGDAATRLLAGG